MVQNFAVRVGRPATLPSQPPHRMLPAAGAAAARPATLQLASEMLIFVAGEQKIAAENMEYVVSLFWIKQSGHTCCVLWRGTAQACNDVKNPALYSTSTILSSPLLSP